MDFEFLSQADAMTLRFEKAKRALETAKSELDQAKSAFEDLLTQADDHGIPKNKLRKLAEERISALFEIGMIDGIEAAAPVKEKPKKKKKDKQAMPDILEEAPAKETEEVLDV